MIRPIVSQHERSVINSGIVLLFVTCLTVMGCGTTKTYTATDQLLMSDAVDATVAQLDFAPLQGKKVFLDSTYVKTQRGAFLVDSDYVISSIRQQMLGDGVQLVEGREEAELVAEARLGALGLDGHNVTYGLPASNALATASSVFTSSPIIPAMPEVSLARHEAKMGAAKIAVFAYDRETRKPYWQSGIARSGSTARDTWILGVGPIQRGTIYGRTRFAGTEIAGAELIERTGLPSDEEIRHSRAFAEYISQQSFRSEEADSTEGVVELASAEEEVKDEAK